MFVLSDVLFGSPVLLAQHQLESNFDLNAIVTQKYYVENSTTSQGGERSVFLQDTAQWQSAGLCMTGHPQASFFFAVVCWSLVRFVPKNVSVLRLRTGNVPKTTFSSKLGHRWGTASCVSQGVKFVK